MLKKILFITSTLVFIFASTDTQNKLDATNNSNTDITAINTDKKDNSNDIKKDIEEGYEKINIDAETARNF